MAERLASLERASRYPWDEWSDGTAWCAKQGSDFDCPARSFRSTLYSFAQRNRLRVRIVVKDAGTVCFQFSPRRSKLSKSDKAKRLRSRQRACA